MAITLFLTNFLSSSAKNTELEMRVMVNQSQIESWSTPVSRTSLEFRLLVGGFLRTFLLQVVYHLEDSIPMFTVDAKKLLKSWNWYN